MNKITIKYAISRTVALTVDNRGEARRNDRVWRDRFVPECTTARSLAEWNHVADGTEFAAAPGWQLSTALFAPTLNS